MGQLSTEELRDYWVRLSAQHLTDSSSVLGSVCYAGMPDWFNGFFDRYQRQALARLTSRLTFEGARVLDVGTGIGRWCRWFSRRGAHEVVGVDLEASRLNWARARDGKSVYCIGSADRLPFADGTFDVVNCVTVLQHVPGHVKESALTDFDRVLRPNGIAIIFERVAKTEDATHVFPWSREQWLEQFRARGFTVEGCVGDQYTPLIRLLRNALVLLLGRRSRDELDAFKRSRRGAIHQLYMAGLKAATVASYPLEEVCLRWLPPPAALINGFLLRK